MNARGSMMHGLRYGFLLTCSLAVSVAHAQTAEEARLTNAGAVLQALTANPETAIPAAVLQAAQGVAVVPGALRMGLIFGGQRGRGVVTVRTENGSWSNPSFITLTGGSIGAQIGVEAVDIVLVFGTERSVRNIGRGKFTLGGDAAVTAGPVGRSTQTTTDLTFTSEVYVYTDRRGLFAGATLEGTRLSIDVASNRNLYVTAGGAQPLGTQGSTTPAAARRFLLSLEQAAGRRAASPALRTEDAAENDEVVTYPLGGAEGAN